MRQILDENGQQQKNRLRDFWQALFGGGRTFHDGAQDLTLVYARAYRKVDRPQRSTLRNR